jgi:hypothetical protein
MLTQVDNIVGGDEEDTKLLREMAAEAREYICGFHWCLPIKAMFVADGVGGVIALFLVEFEGKIGGTDDRLWVVVGDLPSAYMVVNSDETPQEALENYCVLMDDWIAAVLGSGDLDSVFPVEAPATRENAELLRSRMAFLREHIIPSAPTEAV